MTIEHQPQQGTAQDPISAVEPPAPTEPPPSGRDPILPVREPRAVHRDEFNNDRVLQLRRGPEAAAPGARGAGRAIWTSNLDEFYMVRVSGLIEQLEGGVVETSPDGLGPEEQVTRIAATVGAMRRVASDVWTRERVCPRSCAESGVEVLPWEALTGRRHADLRRWFEHEVFPLCTPLVLDPAPSVPFISNRSLNLAVLIDEGGEGSKLARVKIPTVLPRLVRVGRRGHTFVLLEDPRRHHLYDLFPDVPLAGAFRFRVVRDADVEIRELEAGDLHRQDRGDDSPPALRRSGPARRRAGHARRGAGSAVPAPRGRRPQRPSGRRPARLRRLGRARQPARFRRCGGRRSAARGRGARAQRGVFLRPAAPDVLVHQPFDSFHSVEPMVSAAVTDPAVIGIKQTALPRRRALADRRSAAGGRRSRQASGGTWSS